MLRNNNDSKISSIIGPEVEVDGDVKVVGSILIYGKINGSVSATGSVRTARDSHIQGNVEGHITVKNKTVLEKGCILNGDLTSSIVVIEEGASFKGLCNMEGIEAVSKEADEPKDFESSMAESYHEDSIE